MSSATTAAPPRAIARSLFGRLSLGHGVMLAAALVAGVANYAVLRGEDTGVPVVVAASELQVGEIVHAADLRTTLVPEDVDLAGLLDPGRRDALIGGVVTASTPAGAPVRAGDIRPPAAPIGGKRRMSVPVPAQRAAGGTVRAGDRVDVLRVVDGRAGYVVSSAPVLGVVDRTDALTGGDYAVTLAVDAGEARCLAEALAGGEIDVVVATGTEPVEAAGCAPSGGRP